MATMINDVMRTAKSGMSSAKDVTSSTLHDMLSAAKDGLETAKDVGEDVLESAKDGVATVKEGGEHTFASVSWGIAKGITALAGVATALRKFDADQGLSWIGLTRKRSPLVTIALVTSGVVVGAGIGMLLAPMAGAELRQRILGGSKELTEKASTAVKDAETQVKGIGERAVEAAKRAESKVEASISKGQTEGSRAEGSNHVRSSGSTSNHS